MVRFSGSLFVIASVAWVLADRGASAQDLPGAARCAGDVRGEIVAVDGSVQIQGFGGMVVPGRVGLALCARDEITTGARSRVEFRLVGKNTTTGSSSNSVTVIPGMSEECVTLRQGIMAFISSVIGRHCVRTPLIDGGIDGTEAVVVADPDTGASFLMVREGVVTVTDRRDPAARIILTASATDRPAAFATPVSEVTAATAETVPPAFRSLFLQPEAATDWAVYYPPILLARDDDPVLAEAADLLAASDPEGVETLLAGRSDAGALALRSIAAVFRNRGAEGLELAKQAVASDPDAPPGHIAESYANQALGGLDRALESAERAVATGAGAEDAFAWARLAELHLTLGQSRSAARAVARSLALGETALARSIEGFAALARSRFAPAEEAFRRAIILDSELPLARLGLGLAAIRQGDLAAGRQEIETATALDPRAASLRGWLGRAYLAEGESEKAGNQFALAQQADPDDPNAYLFEALRLFNANRPVEALSQVERAQSSGEARSVLRSAAGLGEDRAVQSSAIGRIFDVLGFEDLFRITASEAVAEDPTNPEARLLLADAARTDPDAEITQVSERLKATLLAPPSKTPLQPSLTEIDLALLETTGPARVTFSEFAPLFDGNGVRADLTGFVGAEETFGYEASASALYDTISISVGTFLFDTNGFAVNNDLRHESLIGQVKFQPITELTLFGEISQLETLGGDRRIDLLPGQQRLNALVVRSENKQYRIGAHFRPGPNLSIIGYVEGAELERSFDTGGPFSFEGDDDGYKAEISAFARFGPVALQFGAEHVEIEGDNLDFNSIFAPPNIEEGSFGLTRAYGYVDLGLPLNTILTAGAAWERYTERGFGAQALTLSEIQPRFAIRTEPIEGVSFRAAYSEALARPVLFPETLDRTELAGFTQVFDDAQGIEFRSVSGGVDTRLLDPIRAGVSVSSLRLRVPDRGGGSNDSEADRVQIQGYVSATLGDRAAVSIEPSYTNFDNSALLEVQELDTWVVPVTGSYFHPSGAFASGTLSFASQSGIDDFGRTFSDQGAIFDAVIGFRLPNGRGVVTLEALNLFDTQLELVDNTAILSNATFQDTLTQRPRFAPRRSIIATAKLRL